MNDMSLGLDACQVLRPTSSRMHRHLRNVSQLCFAEEKSFRRVCSGHFVIWRGGGGKGRASKRTFEALFDTCLCRQSDCVRCSRVCVKLRAPRISFAYTKHITPIIFFTFRMQHLF